MAGEPTPPVYLLPLHFPKERDSVMTHTQNTPIFAELWRNHVAAEIQNNPLRYIHGDDADAEAQALAAGELARRDFNGKEPEPAYAKFDAVDLPATNALLVAARIIIAIISVAIIVGVCLAYVTYPEWRY